MSDAPLFSIVTACRNDLPRLEATARSLEAQTCGDWEWVVVDAASTDGTAEWLAAHPGQRLFWRSERDRGIYDAFNKGFHRSRGRYVIWLCAGDLLEAPDVLERVRRFIGERPDFDLYYGDTIVKYEDGSTYLRQARSHTTIWYSEFTHHQSIFYSRRCFDLASYREEHRIGGDYTFNAELLHKGARAIRMPDLTVAVFPVGGTSYKNFWQGERDNWACRRDILGMPLVTRAAIYATHAAVRGLRVGLPGVYRALRYVTPRRGGSRGAARPASHAAPPAAPAAAGLAAERLLGLTIRSGRPADCVRYIDAEAGRSTVKLGFVNTYTAYLLSRDGDYKDRLGGFLLLNDGLGLDIASLMTAGRRFPNNLNGTDFIPYFLQATSHRFRVFLLGARPGVAEKAAVALAAIAPRHAYVGQHHGYFDAAGAPAVEASIRTSGADLVIVALGNPAQERWISEHADRLGLKVAIGAGALLDFVSGSIPRAPAWMRRVRLEWLYRLGLEPARMWKRYVVYTPAIILRVVFDRLLRRAEVT